MTAMKFLNYLTFSQWVRPAIAITLSLIIMQRGTAQEVSQLGERRITPANERALDNGLIRATVRVAGEDHIFIVDTGATQCVFDERLRASCSNLLGEFMVGSGYASMKRPFFQTANAEICDRRVQLGPVCILDLSELSSVAGGDISGILGLLIFRDFVVGYQAAEEVYYAGLSYVRRFDSTFPVVVESACLWTSDIEIGIHVDRFTIDTGMRAPLSLSKEHFDEAQARGLVYGIVNSSSYAITGPHASRTGFLKALTIWKHPFKDVPIVEASHESVGLGLLQKFDFRINAQKRTIEISTNRKTDQPFDFNRSGIGLKSAGGMLLVANVDDGSPGQQAGVCEQDAIVAINDQAVEAGWVGLSEARAALSDPVATEVDLTIRSQSEGNKVLTIRLRPKPVAP